MATTKTRRPLLRIIVSLLLVLVVAAGAYGGFLYMSLKGINEHIDLANQSYEQCLAQLDQEQYDDALVSIRTTISETSQIRQGLDEWQWTVAEKLPYLSQDVTCGRQTAQIADDLASKALLPVIEKSEEIMSDVNSADPLTGLGNAISKLPALYTTLTDARKVVADCKTRSDALPTSHFDDVNAWAESIRTAATDADSSFAQLDGVFGAIDTLGELANTLTAPTDAPQAPEQEVEAPEQEPDAPEQDAAAPDQTTTAAPQV